MKTERSRPSEFRNGYSAGNTNAADYDLREFLTTKQLHVTGMHHSDLYGDIWADPDDHIYYFAARWYDPAVGRFVGRDPLNGVFLYAYCGNVPTRAVDPTGMWGAVQHEGITLGFQNWEEFANCTGENWDEWVGGNLAADEPPTKPDEVPWWGNELVQIRKDYHCFDHPDIDAAYAEGMDWVKAAALHCDDNYFGKALHFLQDCELHHNWGGPNGHLFGGTDEDLLHHPASDVPGFAARATRDALLLYSKYCCCSE